MAKVSIALRGWRFEEAAVFADDGRLRSFEAMPDDDAERIARLPELVGKPCDACWLLDEEEAATAEIVYGEPLSEVLLCADHEDDFVYWFREAGGDDHRGEPDFADAFHEWFLDGGRAPDWFDGIDHVDTDPQALPDLPDEETGALDMHLPDEEKRRIDLKRGEVVTGADADRDDEPLPADADVDLSRDYPG